MENKDLQVENGNFTRIVNPLIEELIKIPFKGCELAVILFIIRKTYGFQKKQDEISLTQFEEALGRSRPVIVKALKNLQLVGVLKLVKVGSSKTSSNLWEIEKYHKNWKLVNLPKLVKHRATTSKASHKKLVKVPKHTKENTKENTKEILSAKADQINQILDIFYKINPNINYGNKTSRKAVDWMINKYGLDDLILITKYACHVQGEQYAPTITTPHQLKEKMAQLKIYHEKQKSQSFNSSSLKL